MSIQTTDFPRKVFPFRYSCCPPPPRWGRILPTYLGTRILNCVCPTSVTQSIEAMLYLKQTAQRKKERKKEPKRWCFLLLLIQIPMKLDNQMGQLNSQSLYAPAPCFPTQCPGMLLKKPLMRRSNARISVKITVDHVSFITLSPVINGTPIVGEG